MTSSAVLPYSRYTFLVTDGYGQYTYTCNAHALEDAIEQTSRACGEWSRVELQRVEQWH